MRWAARATVAALSIIVLLAGAPLILIRLRAVPMLDQLPAPAGADRQAVHQVILAAGALAAVLAVAVILAGIALRTGHAAARLTRHLPCIRAPRPLQGLSAAVLGTITVTSAAAPAAAHAPAHTSGGGLADTLTNGPARQILLLPARPRTPASLPHAETAEQVDEAPVAVRTGAAPHGQLTLLLAGHQHSYVVRRGDNLSHIARDWLGNANRWPEIYHLNHGRHFPTVGGTLTNPNLIYPGWILTLPDDARPPGSNPSAAVPDPAPSGTPAPADAAPQTTTPPPTTPGASTTPSSPAAPITAPATPPAMSSPSASTAATARPSPRPSGIPGSSASTDSVTPASSPHPAASQPAPRQTKHGQPGVGLPSQGWVSLGLAATIAVAAALLRLQARRRARLHYPIPISTRPQPAPVPASLAAVDAAGTRLLEMHDGASALPGVLPVAPAVPAPVGLDAHGGEVSLFDLPGPGLALHGPGAQPAARAILAAILSTGLVQHLTDRAVVVTSVDTLTGLLPPGQPPVGLDPDRTSFDGERLIVMPDTAAVVSHAEEEMIHRRRLLDSMGADTVSALNARNDHAENQPQYVLLVQADPRHAARIQAVAAHRQSLNLHPVLVGALDGIPTVEVAADGTVDTKVDNHAHLAGSPIARLSTLSARDLVDVLALVASVAPRPEEGSDVDEPTPAAEPLSTSRIETASTDGTDAAQIPTRSGGTAALVRVAVLGPISATTASGPVGTGMRSGSYGVLALLAAHPAGRTREQLAADLYPDADQQAADNRIRTDITTTRRVLRHATGHHEAKFILYDPGTGRYRLDPDTVEVDLWRMLTAIQAANTASDDQAALAALRDAAERYHGDFANGQHGAWALDYATTYRHQILSVYARIAEILETDHPEQALAALEAAIERDPVNEELYQRVMRIHGRLGRPDAVRRTMRLLEDRLADLGEAEPSEPTHRLAARQLNPVLTRRADMHTNAAPIPPSNPPGR